MNVKIYSPSKSSMQSGRAKAEGWILEMEPVSPRKPESLMGWTSSADTLAQVRLKFPTLEEARRFAEAKGWSATVLPSQTRKITPRNYVDNFKYLPPEDQTAL